MPRKRRLIARKPKILKNKEAVGRMSCLDHRWIFSFKDDGSNRPYYIKGNFVVDGQVYHILWQRYVRRPSVTNYIALRMPKYGPESRFLGEQLSSGQVKALEKRMIELAKEGVQVPMSFKGERYV